MKTTSLDVEAKSDLDFGNLDEVKSFIYDQVAFSSKRYHPRYKFPLEDLQHDCYTHFLMFRGRANKSWIERYDENLVSNGRTTSRRHFVKLGVRNWLIDQERTASRRITAISASKPVGFEGATLMDVLGEAMGCDNGYHESQVSEELHRLIELLKGEREWGTEVLVPVCGYSKMSYYTIHKLFLHGYSAKEVAKFYGVTAARVNRLYRRGVDILVKKYGVRGYLSKILA